LLKGTLEKFGANIVDLQDKGCKYILNSSSKKLYAGNESVCIGIKKLSKEITKWG